jgi:hypothetical protein
MTQTRSTAGSRWRTSDAFTQLLRPPIRLRIRRPPCARVTLAEAHIVLQAKLRGFTKQTPWRSGRRCRRTTPERRRVAGEGAADRLGRAAPVGAPDRGVPGTRARARSRSASTSDEADRREGAQRREAGRGLQAPVHHHVGGARRGQGARRLRSTPARRARPRAGRWTYSSRCARRSWRSAACRRADRRLPCASPTEAPAHFCEALAGQRYIERQLMPIHNHCGCGVEPITRRSAATSAASRERLERGRDGVHAAVREHGELGPSSWTGRSTSRRSTSSTTNRRRRVPPRKGGPHGHAVPAGRSPAGDQVRLVPGRPRADRRDVGRVRYWSTRSPAGCADVAGATERARPRSDPDPDPDPRPGRRTRTRTRDEPKEPDWKREARKHERRAKAAQKRADDLQKPDRRGQGRRRPTEKAIEDAKKEARDEALAEAAVERAGPPRRPRSRELAAKGVKVGDEDDVKFADTDRRPSCGSSAASSRATSTRTNLRRQGQGADRRPDGGTRGDPRRQAAPEGRRARIRAAASKKPAGSSDAGKGKSAAAGQLKSTEGMTAERSRGGREGPPQRLPRQSN